MYKLTGFLVLLMLVCWSCDPEEVVPSIEILSCNDQPEVDCDRDRPLSPPTSYQLDSIGLISENSAYELPLPIEKFEFVNASIGYAHTRYLGNDFNEVFKTTDGGITWTLLNLPDPDLGYEDLDFKDENTGIVVQGASPNILQTNDGGESWESADTEGVEGLALALTYAADGNLFLATNKDQRECFVYQSTDGGSTWNEWFTYDFAMRGMQIKNGYLFLYSIGEILKIAPSGELLSTSTPANNLFFEVHILGENEYVYQDSPFGIYTTTDGGQTWTQIAELVNQIIGFETVDKGLYINLANYCTEGNNDEDSENGIIVHYNQAGAGCSYSNGAYYINRAFGWSQNMGDGTWYLNMNNYLISLKEL